MIRPLQLAHDFLAQVLGPDDLAIDATMGNGHDTLFLAQRAGRVLAFDIQNQALEQTAARLRASGLDNAQLILVGHEHVASYAKSAKVAIFNLGYLPSADKSIITQPETTLQALVAICQLLESGGRLAIMVYHGHEGGARERDAVLDFVSQLDQRAFAVSQYRMLNQVNTPPFLIMIEKLKKEEI